MKVEKPYCKCVSNRLFFFHLNKQFRRASALLTTALVAAFTAGPARAQQAGTTPPAWAQRYFAAEHHEDHFAHTWLAKADHIVSLRAGTANFLGIPGQYDLRGTFRVAVLPATYSDVTPTVPVSAVDTMLFGSAGGNGRYSLSQYYRENSGGKFTVAGNVPAWMKLAKPRASYGRAITQYIHDALAAADTTVDWRQYDNDGPDGIPNSGDDDGYVDLAVIVHPLADGVCRSDALGGPIGTGWRVSLSGAYNGTAFTTRQRGANGQLLKVEDFVLAASLHCSGSGVASVNITAHEMGHALGLPDLYDLDWSSYGAGTWDLMSYGVWLSDGHPPLMSAWTRNRLGWLDIVPVTADTHLSIAPAESSRTAYRIDIPGTSEYFLLENRQREGADAILAGSGLLVWHVDEGVLANRLPHYGANEDDARPGMTLLQADGRRDLLVKANYGDAGDPFPGVNGMVNLTSATLPGLTGNNGAATHIELHNIAVSNGTVTLDLMLNAPIAQAPTTVEPDGTRIMAQLIHHSGLTTAEQALMDQMGNKDGVFNVGDVQAWMARHGGASAVGVVRRAPLSIRSAP